MPPGVDYMRDHKLPQATIARFGTMEQRLPEGQALHADLLESLALTGLGKSAQDPADRSLPKLRYGGVLRSRGFWTAR